MSCLELVLKSVIGIDGESIESMERQCGESSPAAPGGRENASRLR